MAYKIATTILFPPPLFYMSVTLRFRELPYFVGRVPDNAVKHTAIGVFPDIVPLVSQIKHIFHQLDRFLKAFITWFHPLFLPKEMSLSYGV